MDNWLDILQWPAMVTTIVASFMVGSSDKRFRNTGFWIFLVSNALWIVWGFHAQAWALVLLQAALVVMNIRGMRKTETA